MKICPKCHYENTIDFKNDDDCPSCGVIFIKALEAQNEEKIRNNESKYNSKNQIINIKYSTSEWDWEDFKSRK